MVPSWYMKICPSDLFRSVDASIVEMIIGHIASAIAVFTKGNLPVVFVLLYDCRCCLTLCISTDLSFPLFTILPIPMCSSKALTEDTSIGPLRSRKAPRIFAKDRSALPTSLQQNHGSASRQSGQYSLPPTHVVSQRPPLQSTWALL